VIPGNRSIGIAVYHRRKAQQEWNISFPPTALSAITSPYLPSSALSSSATAGCCVCGEKKRMRGGFRQTTKAMADAMDV
jgi:hypothetical protein